MSEVACLCAKTRLFSQLLCFLICVAPIPSNTDCPPITPGDGSELYPQRTEGGNVTMYRNFHTDSDLSGLHINWTRTPSPLYLSNKRYVIHTKNISNDTIEASITLWDLMVLPDFGRYTVTICSNCTCTNTTYVLYLSECDPDSAPQPIEQYYSKVVAETSLSDVLMLYVVFVGNTDSFLYPLYWKRKDSDVCITTSDSPLISCNRTTYGNCTFTANLYIREPSYKDSGNYTVRAVGSPHHISHNSTYDIDIIKEPRISCEKHHIMTGSVKGSVKCTVYNYSQFLDIYVVKDDTDIIEVYPAHNMCDLIVPERRDATCTIKLSKGIFKICVNYSSLVENTSPLHQCSDSVHVNPDMWWLLYKIALPVLGFILLVVGVSIILCLFWKRSKDKKGMTINEHTERTGLLSSSTSDEHGNGDSMNEHIPEPPSALVGASPGKQGGHVDRDHPTSSRGIDQPTSSKGLPSVPARAASRQPRKVTLVYTQNPDIYLQIRPPNAPPGSLQEAQYQDAPPGSLQEAQYQDEVVRNGEMRKKKVREHRELVARFANFMSKELGLIVVFDQHLDDQHITNKPKWLHENIENSDFVIFVITHSFLKILDNPPDEEIFFKGNYFENLINGFVKNVKIVCVFLKRTTNLEQVPRPLRTGSIYELWEPFHRDSQRGSDNSLNSFVSLMTGTD